MIRVRPATADSDGLPASRTRTSYFSSTSKFHLEDLEIIINRQDGLIAVVIQFHVEIPPGGLGDYYYPAGWITSRRNPVPRRNSTCTHGELRQQDGLVASVL